MGEMWMVLNIGFHPQQTDLTGCYKTSTTTEGKSVKQRKVANWCKTL